MSKKISKKYTGKNSNSRTDIEKLRQRDDRGINYDDSPVTTKAFWKNAEVFMTDTISNKPPSTFERKMKNPKFKKAFNEGSRESKVLRPI